MKTLKVSVAYAEGSFNGIKELNTDNIDSEGSIPGFLSFVCGEDAYGYIPSSICHEEFGDCWVDDWMNNLLEGLIRLKSLGRISIADTENYHNFLCFERKDERVLVSLRTGEVDFAIDTDRFDELTIKWQHECSLSQVVEEVSKVSRELLKKMAELNPVYRESKAWRRLNDSVDRAQLS